MEKTEKIIGVIFLILVVTAALWVTRDLSLRERIVATIGYTFLYSLLFVIATGVLSEIFSSFEWRRFLEKVGEFLKKMRKLKEIQEIATLIPYRKGDKCGYIDKKGKIVIPIQYDDADFFSEGLASVKINGKWGYVDKKGNMVVPPVYDDAWLFSEGLAQVKINGKWGYIDKRGRMVIPAVYDDAGSFSEGLAQVKINGRYGFIDTKGNIQYWED
jgi:hypothetical protein